MAKWRGGERPTRLAGYLTGGQWAFDLACLVLAGVVVAVLLTYGPVAAVATCAALLAVAVGVVVAQIHEATRPGVLAGAGRRDRPLTLERSPSMNRPPMPRYACPAQHAAPPVHPNRRLPLARAATVAVMAVAIAVVVPQVAADPAPAVPVVTPLDPVAQALRTDGAASRSQDRTKPPVTVAAEAVWELDDDGMLAAMQAAFADLEARKAAQEAARLAAEQAEAARLATPPAGSTPDVGSVKAFASDLVGGGEQWGCLEALWQKESGWNHLADNPSSSAYGIPQALPGSKMASAGADWETNPFTQVKWGVGYIEGRYGTACEAWAHSQAHNWY